MPPFRGTISCEVGLSQKNVRLLCIYNITTNPPYDGYSIETQVKSDDTADDYHCVLWFAAAAGSGLSHGTIKPIVPL